MYTLTVEEIIARAAQKREKLACVAYSVGHEYYVIINKGYEQKFKDHQFKTMGRDDGYTHLFGMKIIWSDNQDPSQIIVGI